MAPKHRSAFVAYHENLASLNNEAERLCRDNSVLDKNGCLLWQGKKYPFGHGYVSFRGRCWGVHRLMFFAVNGMAASGLFVCHRCNVPACCNPEHLYAGTQKENMRDMLVAERMHCAPRDGKQKTHCSRGHEFTPENTGITIRGHRYCLVCYDSVPSRQRKTPVKNPRPRKPRLLAYQMRALLSTHPAPEPTHGT